MNNIRPRITLSIFQSTPDWSRQELISLAEDNNIDTNGTVRQLYKRILHHLQQSDNSRHTNLPEEVNESNSESTSSIPDEDIFDFSSTDESDIENFTHEQLISMAESHNINTNGTIRQLYNRILHNLLPLRQLDENENNNNSDTESTISEEDTNDFSSVTSNESDIENIKQFTSNQCKNEDLIMGEPYTVDTNDNVFIMYVQKPNSNKFNDTGICVSKTEIKEYLKSDLTEDNPTVLMTLWTGKDLDNSGNYGKPSGRIIVKMPPFNTFVTLGSLEQMLKNDYNKEWFLYPLYNGKRRRIGNLEGSYGSGQNHGQIPGSIIYKAYNKKQILKGIEIKEEYSDYPLFIYDNFRPLQQILNNDNISIKQLSHGLIKSLIN